MGTDSPLDALVKRLSERHERLPESRRLSVEKLTMQHLVERDVIRLEAAHVVYFDTGPISAYLRADDVHFIESLESLQTLVLDGASFERLDLAGCRELKALHLVRLERSGSINIAESPKLERVVSERLSAETESFTLCAHPRQVGTVFPEDIEDRCRTADNYVTLTLALAPPGIPGFDTPSLPIEWLIRHPEAELADVLRGYWALQPDHFSKYATLERCPDFQRTKYRLLGQIESKVAAGDFRRGARSYDIRRADPYFDSRRFSDERPVPAYMYST